MIVIDVSAVIPYILSKDQDVEMIILEADRIITPVLYVSECGNTLLQYVKKDLISMSEAQNYLKQCQNVIDQMIDVSENGKWIMSLAYENQLSFYDAQYLFLAMASRAKLITQDQMLNKIAEKYGVKY